MSVNTDLLSLFRRFLEIRHLMRSTFHQRTDSRTDPGHSPDVKLSERDLKTILVNIRS